MASDINAYTDAQLDAATSAVHTHVFGEPITLNDQQRAFWRRALTDAFNAAGLVSGSEGDPPADEPVTTVLGALTEGVVPDEAWIDIVGAVGWDESNRCWPKLVAAVENAARKAIEQRGTVSVADSELPDLPDQVFAELDRHLYWHPGKCGCGWKIDDAGDADWSLQWRMHVARSVVDGRVAPVLAARGAEIEKLNLEIQGHQVSDGYEKGHEHGSAVAARFKAELDRLRLEVDAAMTQLAAIKDWRWEKPPTLYDRIELVGSELDVARRMIERRDRQIAELRDQLHRRGDEVADRELRGGTEPSEQAEPDAVDRLIAAEVADLQRMEREIVSPATPTEPPPWTKFQGGQRATATDLDGRTVTGRILNFFAWDNELGFNTRATMQIDTHTQAVVLAESLRAPVSSGSASTAEERP